MPQAGGFQTSRRPCDPIVPAVPAANATGMAMGPERAAPALRPPAPHNQRHHQAGLETCVCSGQKNGTVNFVASGLCQAPGPARSVTRSPWQHSARTAVCSPREGTAGRRLHSPRLTGTAPAPGTLCPPARR